MAYALVLVPDITADEIQSSHYHVMFEMIEHRKRCNPPSHMSQFRAWISELKLNAEEMSHRFGLNKVDALADDAAQLVDLFRNLPEERQHEIVRECRVVRLPNNQDRVANHEMSIKLCFQNVPIEKLVLHELTQVAALAGFRLEQEGLVLLLLPNLGV